jgi:hypothetical protein
MSQPTHWPKFAAAALELGGQCSLSFQLFVRKDNFGALNLYGDEAGVFDDESLLYGEILFALLTRPSQDSNTKLLDVA